jgi:hypothetical protein
MVSMFKPSEVSRPGVEVRRVLAGTVIDSSRNHAKLANIGLSTNCDIRRAELLNSRTISLFSVHISVAFVRGFDGNSSLTPEAKYRQS